MEYIEACAARAQLRRQTFRGDTRSRVACSGQSGHRTRRIRRSKSCSATLDMAKSVWGISRDWKDTSLGDMDILLLSDNNRGNSIIPC